MMLVNPYMILIEEQDEVPMASILQKVYDHTHMSGFIRQRIELTEAESEFLEQALHRMGGTLYKKGKPNIEDHG